MTSLTRQKKKKNLQTFKFCSSKTKINCSEMNNCFQKFLTFWFLLKSNDKIRLNEASGKLQTSSTIFFFVVCVSVQFFRGMAGLISTANNVTGVQ